MIIRRIDENEIKTALELVLRVFMQYEAPDYSNEGVESFKMTALYNEEYIGNLKMFGAYEDDTILGVIATRNNGNHIALFFVDGQYHRKGIGKQLFQVVLDQSTAGEITVNSSPYAKEVYHHLGFQDAASEQISGGIRYIPMIYVKNLKKLKEYCLNKCKSCETYPFGEIPICYKLNGKIFAQIYPKPEDYKITLKCTADAGQFYRQAYPGVVVRGYHCPPIQQPYWNTIYLDKIPEEELLNMIDQAYDTVLQSFSKKVQKQILADENVFKAGHLYSFCGDDCSVCPRYTAQTEAELERVAELWYRAGWRNRILPAEEMKCSGCSLDKECGFHLVECIKEHAVEKCNQCEAYPCEKIHAVLHKMEQSIERCKEVCSEAEFAVLKKAFFEKQVNLER